MPYLVMQWRDSLTLTQEGKQKLVFEICQFSKKKFKLTNAGHAQCKNSVYILVISWKSVLVCNTLVLDACYTEAVCVLLCESLGNS